MEVSRSHPLSKFDALWHSTLNWQPNTEQTQQFQQLYAEVIAGNQQFNLTRLSTPQAFWEKHLWDSLWGIKPWLRDEPLVCPSEYLRRGVDNDGTIALGDTSAQPLQVIDIGTGPGFPGVPIAIAQPIWVVTLLDATRKKIAFLNRLQQTLNVQNIVPLCDRAEHLGQSTLYRDQFDLAIIRAVSRATVCAEYALPLLKIGGVAILYRGQWTPADTASLEGGLSQLGGAITALTQTKTPLTAALRHCVYLQKQAPTPDQFPRRVGIPQRSPLA